MPTFYSNGKLFLIGEYYVLEGAKVMALPTKFGQYLEVHPLQKPVLSWKSYDHDGSVWYNDEIAIEDIIYKKIHDNDEKIRRTLIEILHEAHLMNPTILTIGYMAETKLTFPRKWGLGTSSTLINNIAQWFDIDAFILLEKSFGGSGYDIACAQYPTAITYRKKNGTVDIQPVLFRPEFSHNIYFVYLNKKKDSKEAIANFRKKQHTIQPFLEEVSKDTDRLAKGVDYETFKTIFSNYEQQLSSILKVPTVQQELFSDFDGIIKSMGAWGGDFVMVISDKNPREYFISKGYTTIFSYEDMIL